MNKHLHNFRFNQIQEKDKLQEAVKRLVEKGVDLNMKNAFGQSALHEVQFYLLIKSTNYNESLK
jgi:hypothetical protein